jgi:hypothetical protein
MALVAGLLLAGLGVTVWLERPRLLGWYYVRQLAQADEANCQTWVDQIVALDEAPLSGVLEILAHSDDKACRNARVCLLGMIAHWDKADSGRLELARELRQCFSGFSLQGQEAALDVQAELIRESPAPALLPAMQMLQDAGRNPQKRLRPHALALATSVLEHPAHAKDSCREIRELTRAALQDESPDNRCRAIFLAIRPDVDLLEAVVPLLKDPAAEVRRTAMLVVDLSPDAVATDDLLTWLHDPDAEVRHLCDQALRGRGLSERHVQLGRLMTDDRPARRLEVIDLLRRTNDLEPGVWLRRLSHDPTPAVRAAAVRAATEQARASLTDRLEQMAQNDPCPTVRQLAQYYLSAQRIRER